MKTFTYLFLLVIVPFLSSQEFSAPGFSTDWSRSSIKADEVQSGGPSKDGIPSLTNPRFISSEEASDWMNDREAVILVENNGISKAYPLQILTWHEIINDRIGGDHIVVTWCPLCNTTVVFDVSNNPLEFGTTGRLRLSNMLMYDRETESWWQQAEGRAVIGEMTGTQLELYPSLILPWRDVKSIPGLLVVSRETGYNRPYGRNPYEGYDSPENKPFLLSRVGRSRVDISKNSLLDRVLLIPSGDENILVFYSKLRDESVVHRDDIVVFWEKGTASALDNKSISRGRDVGSANAFSSKLKGRELSFELINNAIMDKETASRWNSRGMAVEGPLKGEQLQILPSIQHFWFSASLMAY